MTKIYNVILSGGSGTRLWPLSRESRPKQFLQLFKGKSLFQETVRRNANLVNDFMIITNEKQYEAAKQQAAELNQPLSKKIIEPIGRNTAPAITLACLSVASEDVLFVTPSDQMIGDSDIYKKNLERAITLAKEGYLVTFGIQPTRPETGFGYIEHQEETVVRFTEKPAYKMAVEFLEKGNFLWNSGMFCFKAGVFLEEIKKHHPEIYNSSIEAYKQSSEGLVPLDAMEAIPSESVDYAVFEKSDRIKVVPSSFFWTDLGSFDALLDYQEQQQPIDGLKIIEGEDNHNTHALADKAVYGIGIEDILVIDTKDTLFLMKKGQSDKVKAIYNQAKASEPTLLH
ncbi:mannose-1-phosphate guanylyltransferase [Arenibacter nanhaiticus]|uniref:Mannose-1-phosphate guanylyltransferase n=1 Tax=Arenibacter nanhaiticus TaxID=558155 RepID=A0A1M6LYA6_9FLAO|nr:mannose-1-phosphate guanylyltransferase [Arenibacter nanhaiticus]SHJ76033.1 mannose-1-phosphate guanylyltransferase [Arenibacter nanhaiticus]